MVKDFSLLQKLEAVGEQAGNVGTEESESPAAAELGKGKFSEEPQHPSGCVCLCQLCKALRVRTCVCVCVGGCSRRGADQQQQLLL